MVAATLTMISIPLLVRLFERLASRAAANDPVLTALTPQADDGVARVLIVGYGRVGQLIGELLTRHDVPYVAIDQEAALVARERAAGRAIYYGDATRIELLRRCGIASARAIVLTLNDPDAVEAVLSAARIERPDVIIVARARDAAHATRLYGLDVTDAVPETIEASLQLSEAVLIDLGVPMGLVIASIHEKRDEFRRMLQPSDSERERRAVRATTRSRSRDNTA
jgi:CPA2 family monovalent cation:H+ antiporter-2